MPTISMFYGIVVRMYCDRSEIIHRISTRTIKSIRPWFPSIPARSLPGNCL